jgi:acyl-CoA thioesterase-1
MPRLVLLLALLLTACASEPAPAEAPTPDSALPEPEFADSSAAPGDLAPPDSAAAEDLTYVLMLGNSLTAGYGLPDPDTQAYPALLQDRAVETGFDVRIINAGVSGDTSAGGLRRVDWILQRQPVDVLVLALGANDGLRGLPTDALQDNLEGIIDAVRAKNPEAEVVIAGMEAPPNMGDAYTAAFRQVFRDVADAYDADLVPFLLDGVAGDSALNQADGIHPTAEGQERLAANVWPVLERVLR